jgi:hypothetical protein
MSPAIIISISPLLLYSFPLSARVVIILLPRAGATDAWRERKRERERARGCILRRKRGNGNDSSEEMIYGHRTRAKR